MADPFSTSVISTAYGDKATQTDERSNLGFSTLSTVSPYSNMLRPHFPIGFDGLIQIPCRMCTQAIWELDSILPDSATGRKVKHVLDLAKLREEYENLHLQDSQKWEEVREGFSLAIKKTNQSIKTFFHLADICIGFYLILFAILLALAIVIVVRYLN